MLQEAIPVRDQGGGESASSEPVQKKLRTGRRRSTSASRTGVEQRRNDCMVAVADKDVESIGQNIALAKPMRTPESTRKSRTAEVYK